MAVDAGGRARSGGVGGTLDDGEAWSEAFAQLGGLGFSGILSLLGLGLWMAWAWFALDGGVSLYGSGVYEVAAPTVALVSFALAAFACMAFPQAHVWARSRFAALAAGATVCVGCVLLMAAERGFLPMEAGYPAALLCGAGAGVLAFLFGMSFARLDAGPALVAFAGCGLVCFCAYFCLTGLGELGGDALFSATPLAMGLSLYVDRERIAQTAGKGTGEGEEGAPASAAEDASKDASKDASEGAVGVLTGFAKSAGVPSGFRRLCLACLVYFAAISFTHAMAPVEEFGFASAAGVACMLFVELAVLLAYVALRGTFRILKLCYVASVLLILFANTVAPFTGDTHLAYEALRNASYFTLLMVVWVLLSWVASYGEVAPRRVFGSALCLIGVGMAAGWVAGMRVHESFGDARGTFMVAVGFVVLAFFSFGFNIRDFPRLVIRSRREALAASEGSWGADMSHAAGPAPVTDRLAELAAECDLSPREREVFEILAQGYGGEYIAEQLGVSYHTVRAHVRSIYRKLDVHSREELLDRVRG